MNEKDFCYWLQGFFELKKTIDHREGASAETMQVIEDHLKLVFDKKTPQYNIPSRVSDFAIAQPHIGWPLGTQVTC